MAFSRVQQTTSGSGAANTFDLTFGSPITAGNFAWAQFTWAANTTITSAVDDKGNTWSSADTFFDSGNNQSAAIAWRGNIPSGGPTILTVTFSGTTGGKSGAGEEWSGANASADPNDGHTFQFQATPGTGTDGISSTAIITTVNGDLILGASCNVDGTPNPSAGTNFTNSTANASNAFIQTEFLNAQGTAGSIAATFTSGTANRRITHILAVKAPAAAGNVLQPKRVSFMVPKTSWVRRSPPVRRRPSGLIVPDRRLLRAA